MVARRLSGYRSISCARRSSSAFSAARPRSRSAFARTESASLRSSAAFGAAGTLGGLRDQIGANQQIDRSVLSRFDALDHVAAPRPKRVDPGLNRVDVLADGRNAKAALPPIVLDRLHGHFIPEGLLLRAMQEQRREDFVAVREDVGGDFDFIAHDALDRIAAAVQLRQNVGDGDAFRMAGRPAWKALNCCGDPRVNSLSGETRSILPRNDLRPSYSSLLS